MRGINHLNKYIVDSTTVSGSSGSLLAMLTVGFVPMSLFAAATWQYWPLFSLSHYLVGLFPAAVKAALTGCLEELSTGFSMQHLISRVTLIVTVSLSLLV